MEKDELMSSFRFVFNKVEKGFLTISYTNDSYDSSRKGSYSKATRHDEKIEALYFELLLLGFIYKATYTIDKLKEIKSDLGFEGSLDSFLSLINQAARSKSTLRLNQQSKSSITLIITLNINEIIRMKVEINLSREDHTKVESYAGDIEKTIERIYNHREDIENSSKIQSQPSKQLSLNEDSTSKSLEIKKNHKRRFNSNLINPNIKKRNLLGAKFVVEENSADSG